MTYAEIFEVMKMAALEAGQYLNSQFLLRRELAREYKPDASHSIVTQADKNSEKMIIERFHRHLKGEYNIVTEETDRADYFKDPGFPTLIIDPLDGTTSFVTGHTYYTVTIGLMHQGRFIAGVVYAPGRGEFFYGLKERGAFMDYIDHPLYKGQSYKGLPLQLVSINEENREVLIQSNKNKYDVIYEQYLKAFSTLDITVRKKSGSAAYNFIQVAAGRLHIQQGPCLQFWDIAGAMAIIEEMGGKVDLEFQNSSIQLGEPLNHDQYHLPIARIIAGHPDLVTVMKKFEFEHSTKNL